MSYLAHLPDRAVIAIRGEDRVKFLQGLVSNDVTEVEPGKAVWAALLTAQGRWKADFFIFADPDEPCLLLDCAASQVEMIVTTLSRFRLRADVTIQPTRLVVHAAWGALPDTMTTENAILAPDPRLPGAGWRLLLLEPAKTAKADVAEYDLHRLVLGLPDGVRDCEPEKTLLLEANFDLLNGISWTKGCYMGQELTARTRYRGLVKRRLVPVASEAPLPPVGTPIRSGDKEVGQVRSSHDHCGLAFLRPEVFAEHLEAAGHRIVPRVPVWLASALSENEQKKHGEEAGA
ncbi:glycine cleavage system protein T [Acetobacter estunensis NRIC 0472]|uniref:Folate-binding protein n=1 Tax=Acetobacter estunensis TaxID=104097 RepID=A0A967EJG9_9PROT|nr:folate-binding protein YgfZ [Acetobacter estunensis]NHO55089.1 folate-binding protein [Acetobacter estunensis]GBQ27058.1 glycine cleavage system protein T [Acetobacter estunensis NRIC 0472]